MRDIFQSPEQKSLSPEKYGVVTERYAEVMDAVANVVALETLEIESGDQHGSVV